MPSRSLIYGLSLLALAGSVSAIGILLPLYIYPSAVFNDSAANWQPVFTSIRNNPTVPHTVVINPASGPGAGGPGNGDLNYMSGTAQLNALPRVRTIGYVHNLNGQRPAAEVEADIARWRQWNDFAGANISVQGIFFDEAIEPSGVSDGSGFDYLNGLIGFARSTFPAGITTICNFGAKPADVYYSICDIIVAFESALNAADVPKYQDLTTIQATIPLQTRRAASAILVHDYAGPTPDGSAASTATLKSSVDTLKSAGVGWAYFCTEGYEDSVTAAPASLANVAADMA